METINFLIVILTVCLSYIQISDSATLKFDTDSRPSPYAYNTDMDSSSEGDLVYSDITSKHQESRERLYRQLRQYGVPSDVAQMYVPRGLTVGELLGKGTTKPHHSSAEDNDEDEPSSSFDPWSIVWYIGSFGGLIAFFLVISCSEWCCLRSRAAATLAAATAGSASSSRAPRSTRCPPNTARGGATPTTGCDTPPPSYHLFAPPSYDDTIIFEEKNEKNNGKDEKKRFDVFVVGVHSVPEVVPPPNYTEIHMNPS